MNIKIYGYNNKICTGPLKDSRNYDRPCSLLLIVCVPSCFFLLYLGLISMSMIKNMAVTRHSTPKTIALSSKSSGMLSVDESARKQRMLNRITPRPSRNTSFKGTITFKWINFDYIEIMANLINIVSLKIFMMLWFNATKLHSYEA